MTTDITSAHPDVEVDPDDARFEFDEQAVPEDGIDLDDDADLDEGADLEDGDDDLAAVDTDGGGIDTDLVVLDPALAAVLPPTEPPAPADSDPDDDVLIVDEVEASLDIILAERMRSGDTDMDQDDDEEDGADDSPSQLATVIPVRRPEEFLCQSCFLLKPPGQLADIDHQLCRDCA